MNLKWKIVEYIDSHLIDEQTSEIVQPVKITAIGFVVEETDEYITLAREVIGDEYRGQVSIPKISILLNQHQNLFSFRAISTHLFVAARFIGLL